MISEDQARAFVLQLEEIDRELKRLSDEKKRLQALVIAWARENGRKYIVRQDGAPVAKVVKVEREVIDQKKLKKIIEEAGVEPPKKKSVSWRLHLFNSKESE